MAAYDADLRRDVDGFLLDAHDWDETVAQWLAREEGVTLTAAHIEILQLLRDYFGEHEHAPAMRALVSLARRKLGPDKGRSVYLLALFPGSPARMAAKIAGLPRPEHCL